MKNDRSFTFVAAIIIAGVIVALVSPSPSVASQQTVSDETTTHAAQ